jgi:hypothetical protein
MSIPLKDWPKMEAGETDYRGTDWKNDLAVGETITSYGFESDDLTIGTVYRDPLKPITFALLTPKVASGETAETRAFIDTSNGRHLVAKLNMLIY